MILKKVVNLNVLIRLFFFSPYPSERCALSLFRCISFKDFVFKLDISPTDRLLTSLWVRILYIFQISERHAYVSFNTWTSRMKFDLLFNFICYKSHICIPDRIIIYVSVTKNNINSHTSFTQLIWKYLVNKVDFRLIKQ